ncbi:MAG: radical SAM protein [Bacteroidota bacterium]
MFDRYDRKINYLRVSVTDRCNLRCEYCMPEGGIQLIRHEDILSFEEITEIIKTAVKAGVDKVRITGGEPLVRKGIISLVEMIARIDGIRDLSMTTNGTLLKEYASQLKAAGLMRINISLDTIDPDRYHAITRGGDLKKVIAGIVEAQKAGLAPIKINCVVHSSSDESDAIGVQDFCRRAGLEIRFIHLMNLHRGEFTRVEGGDGGNCKQCNRLRLAANGKIMPCLFSDLSYDTRQLGAEKAIQQAVEHKPACGSFSNDHEFYNTGG